MTRPDPHASYREHVSSEAEAVEEKECGNCLARWRCFHCGEVFADEESAKEHFGPDTEWEAGCIDPLTKDEKERRAYQIGVFRELDREREENSRLTNRDYILSRWEADLAKFFRGSKSVHQAMLVLDEMEGRALAAEAKLATARKALERANRLCKEALPKFDWGKSALDANAIQLLNEVPGEIRAALNSGEQK